MNRETIDHWLERVLLGLVLGVLVFGPLALGGVRPTEFVVLQWLLLGVLGVWLLRLWVAPTYRFLMPPTAWLILPFVAYAAWRYRTADIEYLARQEFILVALAAVLFLAIVNNLYGQTELRVLTVTLVGLGTLVAMYGIFQWLTGGQQVWHFTRPGYEGRGSGSYISPNHLAGFLEMILPLAVMFAVLRGFRAVPRIIFAYGSFVLLVGIAATGSRGGWLATGGAMVVLTLVLIRKKGHLWAALAVLLVVGGTGAWLYARALAPRVEKNRAVGAPEHDDVRLRLWTSARQMWLDHPWAGVGPDHFDYRYRGYRKAHSEMQLRPGRAHNDYLNTLVDWGVVGLLLVLAPVVAGGAGVVLCWRYLQRSGETGGSRVATVLGCAIGLIALLVHSFFDFNMHIPANALLATALLAIVTAHWRFASQRFWFTARWPARIAATLGLAGALYYLGPQTLRHTREARALRAAAQAETLSPARMAALRAAFEVEPKNFETASAIGEELRLRSSLGQDGYEKPALEAVEWFQRASVLNPWDPLACLRTGMALHWAGRHAEAGPYFDRAVKLDPNHWYTRGMMGWHHFQLEDFAETKRWMKSSLEVEGARNNLAFTYLELAEQRLAGQGSGHPALRSLPELR